jgi:NitT/TauT family transport system permease protein
MTVRSESVIELALESRGGSAPLHPPVTIGKARKRRSTLFALRREIPSRVYSGLALGSFLTALALWQWVGMQSFVNPVFLPSPARVLTAAIDFFSDGSILTDVKTSFLRVSAGFLLSIVFAVPIGILIGSFKVGEGVIQPFTEFVRYIPVPAMIPLMMVLFGIGELPKVMLIFAGTYFQMVLMVADEIRRVPYDLVQVSYTLGAKRSEIIQRVLLPAASPGIFDALRLCNGWAWTYLVVAELVAANEGLGYRILKFSRFLQTPKIFVYLLLLGLIGLALDAAFRFAHRRLFAWAVTERG